MTIRNIFLPIVPDVPFDRQLAVALDLARRLEAHIAATFIRPDPVAGIGVLPEAALAVAATIEAIERDGAAQALAARQVFHDWRLRAGLASGMVDLSLRIPFACWSERTAPVEIVVTRSGRLSDLIILNRPDGAHNASQAAFDAAIFATGRPTILLPPGHSGPLLDHVLVAWNGSLEATRAIGAAMPLLHEADEVSVFTKIEEDCQRVPDLDLAEYLSWHGVKARYHEVKPGGQAIGPAFLEVAKDFGATLLVMGAYTHSRLRQRLLGGATKHVVAHAETPFLMVH